MVHFLSCKLLYFFPPIKQKTYHLTLNKNKNVNLFYTKYNKYCILSMGILYSLSVYSSPRRCRGVYAISLTSCQRFWSRFQSLILTGPSQICSNSTFLEYFVRTDLTELGAKHCAIVIA